MLPARIGRGTAAGCSESRQSGAWDCDEAAAGTTGFKPASGAMHLKGSAGARWQGLLPAGCRHTAASNAADLANCASKVFPVRAQSIFFVPRGRKKHTFQYTPTGMLLWVVLASVVRSWPLLLPVMVFECEEGSGWAMSEERSGSFFPVNAAAIVAVITGFFLVPGVSDESGSSSPNSVKGSRSAVENVGASADSSTPKKLAVPTFRNVVTVPSGLWNDPFEGRNSEIEFIEEKLQPTSGDSTAESRTSQSSQCTPPEESAFSDLQQFLTRKSEELKRRLIIMPVLVEGGSVPGRTESRVNARHAVEHAMATATYQMEFAGRMSFVRPIWSVWFGEKWRRYRADVPIKFYSAVSSPDGDSSPPVLICWIDSQYLGGKPLGAIMSMLKNLLGNDLLRTCDVKLIGPNYSSELENIIRELRRGQDEDSHLDSDEKLIVKMSDQETFDLKTDCNDFSIFSPSATNPPSSLVNENGEPRDKLNWFTSTIAFDASIQASMLNEMKYRRRQHGRVVIVAESGGRSPRGMAARLKEKLKEDNVNVVSLEYLKHLSSVENSNAAGTSSNASAASGTDDYFRRQLSEISQAGDVFRGDSVSAVLVLGDDISDKLTVIRNLRRIFTNATFFTHDLNHQYFDPRNLEFTRGLIVVSRGYLTADYEDKSGKSSTADTAGKSKTSAPGVVFRDVYQKTRYLAVLKALGVDSDIISQERVTVFEMGFNGPNELQSPLSWGRLLRGFSMLLCLLAAVGTIAGVILLNRTDSLWQEAGKGWQRLLGELKTLLRVMSPTEPLQQGQPSGGSANTDRSKRGRKARSAMQLGEPADAVSLWQTCRLEYQKRLTGPRTGQGVLFSHLYRLRAELALAAIAALLVWREEIVSDACLAALIITFAFLAVLLIHLSLLPALLTLVKSERGPRTSPVDSGPHPSEEVPRPDSGSVSDQEWVEKVVSDLDNRKQDRSPDTTSDGILARLVLYEFLFLLLIFVVQDIKTENPLLQEPIAIFSGISSWPVLAGLLVVIVLAMRWLSITWGSPLRASGGRCSSMLPPDHIPSCEDQLSGRLLQTFHDLAPFVILFLRRHHVPGAVMGEATDSDTKSSIECERRLIQKWALTSSRFSAVRLLTIARLSMLSLMLMYVCFHVATGTGTSWTWALLPLPPARGTLVLAATSFLGVFGLLLTLLVSLTGLIQVCLLLSLVGGLEKRWRGYIEAQTLTDLPFPRPIAARAFSACDFLQQSSSSTIRNALQNPALLLLAYALCRFPLIESWTVDSNSVILIAGIPTLLAVGTAMFLRVECNRFRDMIIRTLEREEFPVEQAVRTELQSIADRDTEESLKSARTRIAAMTQGAFGSIWRDPILGSFLFLATAISSSQKLDPLRLITVFLFGG